MMNFARIVYLITMIGHMYSLLEVQKQTHQKTNIIFKKKKKNLENNSKVHFQIWVCWKQLINYMRHTVFLFDVTRNNHL